MAKKIIAGECLPSWNLSLIKKIIFIICTNANKSLNFDHCLFMAFSDLEMQKHKNFLEKHYTDVHTIIEQKP